MNIVFVFIFSLCFNMFVYLYFFKVKKKTMTHVFFYVGPETGFEKVKVFTNSQQIELGEAPHFLFVYYFYFLIVIT